MICDNDLCIYWEDTRCILDSISIDSQGHCAEYLQTNFPESFLAFHRAQTLASLEESFVPPPDPRR